MKIEHSQAFNGETLKPLTLPHRTISKSLSQSVCALNAKQITCSQPSPLYNVYSEGGPFPKENCFSNLFSKYPFCKRKSYSQIFGNTKCVAESIIRCYTQTGRIFFTIFLPIGVGIMIIAISPCRKSGTFYQSQ